MNAAPMTLVETPFFLRKAAALLDDEERSELLVFLGVNPEAVDVVPETGGVRKVRWAAKGHGKRGGARVIYFWWTSDDRILLLDIYAKGEQENLGAAEIENLRRKVIL